MDWHCINFTRGGSHESEAADLVLALEDAYDSAGEPAAHPEAAVPAIGCDPMYLARGASPATSSWTAPLTLATSVSRTVGAISSMLRSSPRNVVTGEASTTSASWSVALDSADSSVPVMS